MSESAAVEQALALASQRSGAGQRTSRRKRKKSSKVRAVETQLEETSVTKAIEASLKDAVLAGSPGTGKAKGKRKGNNRRSPKNKGTGKSSTASPKKGQGRSSPGRSRRTRVRAEDEDEEEEEDEEDPEQKVPSGEQTEGDVQNDDDDQHQQSDTAAQLSEILARLQTLSDRVDGLQPSSAGDNAEHALSIDDVDSTDEADEDDGTDEDDDVDGASLSAYAPTSTAYADVLEKLRPRGFKQGERLPHPSLGKLLDRLLLVRREPGEQDREISLKVAQIDALAEIENEALRRHERAKFTQEARKRARYQVAGTLDAWPWMQNLQYNFNEVSSELRRALHLRSIARGAVIRLGQGLSGQPYEFAALEAWRSAVVEHPEYDTRVKVRWHESHSMVLVLDLAERMLSRFEQYITVAVHVLARQDRALAKQQAEGTVVLAGFARQRARVQTLVLRMFFKTRLRATLLDFSDVCPSLDSMADEVLDVLSLATEASEASLPFSNARVSFRAVEIKVNETITKTSGAKPQSVLKLHKGNGKGAVSLDHVWKEEHRAMKGDLAAGIGTTVPMPTGGRV